MSVNPGVVEVVVVLHTVLGMTKFSLRKGAQ